MSPTFFFTGFPGFLASECVVPLKSQLSSARFVFLVQRHFLLQAQAMIEKLDLGSRAELVVGDITEPKMGLTQPVLERLQAQVTQVFHFAAVYDLAVRAELAHKINVVGTQHVIEFSQGCAALERFHYISTCYVSGKFDGVFSERDLDRGQNFNNFYESTKYEAEKVVQKARDEGLPTIIYRPAIVVGDSKTGVTQKLDGPYFVINFLLKQPSSAVLPRLGDPARAVLNLVPSDFVIRSIAALSQHAGSLGQVFQLADPNPPTIAHVIQKFGECLQKKIHLIPLPLGLTKNIIALPGVKHWLKIPAQTLDYFVLPTRFDSSQTHAVLSQLGISPPQFDDYVGPMVAFVSRNQNIRSKAMI